MKKGQEIANIAFAEVGTKESPTNSNKQKYGKWFGFDGVMWCAIFVSWCYDQAGKRLEGMGYKKGFAGCQTAVSHFKNSGEIVKREDAKVGDIMFFDWNGDKRYDHVGIFNGWKDKEKWEAYTLEGNTSKTNQSNGGEVMNRTRLTNNVVFAHPKILDQE